MKIKESKRYQEENSKNINTRLDMIKYNLDLETIRAMEFLVAQMKKGILVEDIFTQIKQSYSLGVSDALILSLKKLS